MKRANFNRLIAGANEAGELAKSSLSKNNTASIIGSVLAIAISCVRRQKISIR